MPLNNKLNVLSRLVIMILAIYITPIVLMLTDVISSDLKYHVLIGMSTLLLIYARVEQIPFHKLGFRKDNLKAAFARVMPLSLFVCVPILIFFVLGWFRSDGEPAHWTFYIFYVFVSASLQEFIYRGFLVHRLIQVGISKSWTIVISSALYGFMHIIFDIPSVIFTFLIGLFWGWAYYKDRNIYSVTASHSILGSLSLLANFS